MTDLRDLAKRAVVCKGWRWTPGVVALGLAGARTRLGESRRIGAPDEYAWPHDLGLRWPDLSDPATVGALEALVCELYPGAVAVVFGLTGVVAKGGGRVAWWRVVNERQRVIMGGNGRTMDADMLRPWALVCALEAAQGGE